MDPTAVENTRRMVRNRLLGIGATAAAPEIGVDREALIRFVAGEEDLPPSDYDKVRRWHTEGSIRLVRRRVGARKVRAGPVPR